MQNFESKLARVLDEEVEMIVEKTLQLSILRGVTNQPESPQNVATFIGPGAKVSVVQQILLPDPRNGSTNCSLYKTNNDDDFLRLET